jgi:hypothetical protein
MHNGKKHFFQMFSLANNIVKTLMGAFNAFEIQKLISKFKEMSQGHNMLVGVTQ